MGGTKIAAHLINNLNEVIWQDQRPTASGSALLPAICEVIDEAITHVDLDHGDNLKGIGIGIPGQVVPEKGELCLAVNLDIDKPLPVGTILKERYGVEVRLENDVRSGAKGVHRFLNMDNVAYINIGTGLAAGLVLNGEVYRGKNGLAGEIGHIVETYHGDEQLVLENIVSGPGLVAEAAKVGCDVSNPAELFTLAESGHEAAQGVLDRFFYHLARAIQWMALTFDIDQMVLGGGVTHVSDSFEPQLRSAVALLRERSKVANLLLADDKLTILPKFYNPGLWGATYLVQDLVCPDLRAPS